MGTLALLGCEPELVIGTWECGGSAAAAPSPPGDAAPPGSVELPWHTGFEDGFCGYAKAGGFCYANPEASYDLTTAPVRSGEFAAAFHVSGDPSRDGLQARCARSGELPQAAYYGAWFFVPNEVTLVDNYNLFHFDGNGADVHHDLWDVSLGLEASGALRAYVFDFLRMTVRPTGSDADVPVGEWFHLEVYWDRASDATGSFELYVDGSPVLSLTDLSTDDSQSGAEWYVGSLATELTPRPNTLYVDDVTLSSTRRGGP